MRKCASDTGLLYEFALHLDGFILSGQLEEATSLPVLKEILRLLAAHFSLIDQDEPSPFRRWDTWAAQSYGQHHSSTSLGVDELSRGLHLLVNHGLTDHIGKMLDGIRTTSQTLSQSPIEHTMLPFLQRLLQYFRNQALDWSSEQYRSLFTETFRLYISATMWPEPALPQQIQPRQLGCGCTLCGRLDRFLANESVKEESFKEYVRKRRHLEDRLGRVQTKNLLTWSHQREGKGPEVLRVSKTDGHYEYNLWESQRAVVKNKLSSVAAWPDLSALLDQSFADIVCTAKMIPRLKFPDRLPPNLPSLKEPARTRTWIAECLVADSTATMTQHELWEIYALTMRAVPSKINMLPAVQMLNMVPETIAGASIESGPAYIVKGVRRWTSGRDSSNTCEQNRAPLAPVLNPQAPTTEGSLPQQGHESLSANPRKRRIDVVDLCDSP